MRAFYFLLLLGLVLQCSRAASPSVILRNDQVEVRVDLQHGLVLGFNLPGQANLLWVNPHPVSSPDRNSGWINYGGDKLWWGPMIDWQEVKGRRFPPDEALDGAWQVVSLSPTKLVMRSGVSPWVGIYAEREITLAPDRPEVVFQNRFIRNEENGQRLQLWTISQLPPPQWCLLNSQPAPGETAYVNRRPTFNPAPYTSVIPATGDVRYEYNTDGPNLIGTRGAWIAAVYADTIVCHDVSPFPDGDYATAVSVQLFSIDGFIELETLSGNATPKVGESMSNTVRWHVLPRPPELSDEDLEVWINQQMAAKAAARN
jgi:hypothetical protein